MNIGNLPSEEATGVLYPVSKNSLGLSLVLKNSGIKRAMGAALLRMLQVYENDVSGFSLVFLLALQVFIKTAALETSTMA